jgi:hypothetical protein
MKQKHTARGQAPRICLLAAIAVLTVARLPAVKAAAAPQKKDYLTEEEGDKIRDAYTPGERIKLFVQFADDRLKKFDYELNRKAVDTRRDEMLNSLLNAYAGCVDDAADQIDAANERKMDIREALKIMKSKDQEFLDQLEKYDKGGPADFDMYKDTLEDAIEGTKDALSDIDEAQKENAGPPVRRAP